MNKLISVGLALWIIIQVFSTIGDVSEANTFTLGNAFTVLGAMIMWSIITLMVYKDFIE